MSPIVFLCIVCVCARSIGQPNGRPLGRPFSRLAGGARWSHANERAASRKVAHNCPRRSHINQLNVSAPELANSSSPPRQNSKHSAGLT